MHAWVWECNDSCVNAGMSLWMPVSLWMTISACKSLCESVNSYMNMWMRTCVTQWNASLWVCNCLSESVKAFVSIWLCVSISECIVCLCDSVDILSESLTVCLNLYEVCDVNCKSVTASIWICESVNTRWVFECLYESVNVCLSLWTRVVYASVNACINLWLWKRVRVCECVSVFVNAWWVYFCRCESVTACLSPWNSVLPC